MLNQRYAITTKKPMTGYVKNALKKHKKTKIKHKKMSLLNYLIGGKYEYRKNK